MEEQELTRQIIGCAMKVSNTLGAGFLEKVYKNALALELRRSGLATRQQVPLAVFYEGEIVGEYVADLIVENQVLLELKTARALDGSHQAQLLNYLRATELRIGLILNFGTKRLGIKRMVL